MAKRKFDYVTSNPSIMGGKPVIVGTRIPISRIIFLLKEGYTLENISEDYPHVDLKTISEAIDELVQKLDTSRNAPQTLQI